MASRYSGKAYVRATVIATVFAGTLYILSAFAYNIYDGGEPLAVLRGIAGAVVDVDLPYDVYAQPAIGLALHFAIISVMAAIYLLLASRIGLLTRWPFLCAIVYGLALWGVMNWVVLPWRWPTAFPFFDAKDAAEQIFSNIALVAYPIALVARSATRWRYTSDTYI